jgi:hypothetical protein
MMLIKSNAPYNVLLPVWIFEQAKDREQFKQLLADYMKHYPNYIVRAVKDGMAVCERVD